MEMLGHRDLSTTSIYQRRAQVGQLRAAMSARPY
jgi:site-specific recombinase XerD